MNIESSNEQDDRRLSPFRDEEIGCIDDISIESIKNRERFEIQSILKRPEDSQGNRIECADYNDNSNQQYSQSKSAQESPSQIRQSALKARADTSKNTDNNKLEEKGPKYGTTTKQ